MKKTAILILSFFIFSCTTSIKYEKLIGDWECISWINKASNANKCNNNVYFKFSEDRTYYSKIGKVEDSGKYEIINNILYASPNGKMELAVQIKKINSDTLEFLMNLGGVEEVLTLVKKH
ncbi:hypothetical protein ES708_20350 [subsurface metagenome]